MLTVTEVANELRVTPATVREWLRAQTLHGMRLGHRAGWRVRASELARFIREREGSGRGGLPSGTPEGPSAG